MAEPGAGRDEPAGVAGWRYLVAIGGVAALGYGTWQLVTGGRSTRLSSSLPWLAGALLAHDGVLAPLLVLIGLALTWLLPAPVRRVVAAGLLVGGCLLVVGLPALLAPGLRDNPTATPRDYGHGLLVVLACAAVGTLAAGGLVTLRARLRRRR